MTLIKILKVGLYILIGFISDMKPERSRNQENTSCLNWGLLYIQVKGEFNFEG